MMNKNKKNARTSAKDAQIQALEAKMYKLQTKALKPFANAGEHVGGFFGPTGRLVGRAAGGLIGKILGSGDYVTNFSSIKANSFLNSGPPGFVGGATADVTTITHREYIADVYSSTNFSITEYPLNPGQSGTFPWLGTIADNFEEYKILGMVFEFKSMSADALNSTNTALGTVILATQYDAAKDPFASKQQMENYEFANSTKPSSSILHAIECKPQLTPVSSLYVRPDGQLAGTDIRWSDFGNFYIATTGMQAAGVNIGELWVSYKIQLRKPRISPAILYQSAHISRSGTSAAAPMGTATVYNLGSLAVVITSTTVTFTGYAGVNYYLSYYWGNANSTGSTLAPTTTLTNANLVNYFTNHTLPSAASANVTTSTKFLCQVITPIVSGIVVLTYAGDGNFPVSALDLTITALDTTITQ